MLYTCCVAATEKGRFTTTTPFKIISKTSSCLILSKTIGKLLFNYFIHGVHTCRHTC